MYAAQCSWQKARQDGEAVVQGGYGDKLAQLVAMWAATIPSFPSCCQRAAVDRIGGVTLETLSGQQ